MGAHPGSPSQAHLSSGGSVGLDTLIAQNPEIVLGRETSIEFSGLPFLFKVLDAAKPLSLQVHPGRDQARTGFIDEELRPIPRQSPSRNYKDPNPKPEMVVALGTDFWVLRGFRPFAQIVNLLGAHPELKKIGDTFVPTHAGLKRFFEMFMTAPPSVVESTVRPLVNRWRRENEKAPFPKEDPRYWVLRADALFSSPGRTDRGLLSVLLLNLVKLKPGEGVFIPPGTLHSYLEGTAIEIMANSDNVLRGGLTTKYVDVPELLKTVIFEGALPEILRPEPVRGAESVYRTMGAEFELRRLALLPGVPFSSFPSWSGEIFLVVSGSVTVFFNQKGSREGPVSIKKGQCLFVPRGVACDFRSDLETMVFRAGVPPVRLFRGRRPPELNFGTSGLRGLISDITDLEAYVNTRGFLRYLADQNGGDCGGTVSLGQDLRPSSPRIARAVAQAIRDEGGLVENVGCLPSPALLSYSLSQGRASVMVTGSHIPFDRNGIKFNLISGEVLKNDEPGILRRVQEVRAEEYNRPAGESFFDDEGFFHRERVLDLPVETSAAREAYVRRYLNFFPAQSLHGIRAVVYQHSAVGRDLLVEILRGLGAEVIPLERCDEFLPIDTEDISDEMLGGLQQLVDQARGSRGPVDVLVSTDGDSDRPLVCGVKPDGTLVFLPGDLLGPLVAEYLEADGVVVPVSGNDAVQEYLRGRVRPLTRIGSPYVIDGLAEAARAGCRRAMGYEANGGFLLQSPIKKAGRVLASLPTRDAILPILCVLSAARERGFSLVQLFDQLPRRFGKSGLLDKISPDAGRAILSAFAPPDPSVVEVDFEIGGRLSARDNVGRTVPFDEQAGLSLQKIRVHLESYFNESAGFFGGVRRVNFLDGIRIRFGNGDVVHIRPSGNAPQLRLYVCASSPDRAREIVRWGLTEPYGLLRTLEKKCGNTIPPLPAPRANLTKV